MNIPTRPDVNLVKLPVDDISKLGFKFVTPLKEDLEMLEMDMFASAEEKKEKEDKARMKRIEEDKKPDIRKEENNIQTKLNVLFFNFNFCL